MTGTGARRRLALLAALLVLPGPAAAQYDPAFRWRTLTTDHFELHHHQGGEPLARRALAALERAHARLVPLLGHAPAERTQVVLSDDQDDANGSATPLPRNLIRLYAVPPESGSVLQDSSDWLVQLVEHEYVHVLHLDEASGLPAAVNRVLGRVLLPNVFTPPLLIEGLAVSQEAEDPRFGRNQGALFDAWARTLALDPPGFPSLAEAANQPLGWPRGHVPYLLGGRLVGHLLERGGPEAVRCLTREQGRAVWPWAFGSVFQACYGADLASLWEEFRASQERRARAQVEAIRRRPVTAPTLLTRRGGEVSRPRWAPDGRSIVYLDHGPEERGGLRRAGLDGQDLGRLVPVDLHGAFDLTGPAQAVVARSEVFQEFRVYDDLWLADLRDGSERRLTTGERATDPAVTPGAAGLVYVARLGGGELALRRRPIAGGPAETLLHLPGAQLYDPAVSPDGRRIALSIQRDGRRDLALLEDGRLELLTSDDALDLQPAWTPDGRHLLFASDRGGVFNLHAWSAATGRIRQVTNVLTSALDPAVSPEGGTIAFVTSGRQGYDLAVIPFDEASWLEPAGSTSEPTAPLPSGERGGGEGPPSTPYAPWTALPTFWLPVWSADGSGDTLGVFTTGQDVVGLHTWQAQGWWSLRGGTFGYSASYAGGWSWPALDLLSERLVERSPGDPDRSIAAWTPLAGGLTHGWTRLDGALRFRLGWSATRFDTLGAHPGLAGVDPAFRFDDGLLSEASLGASWSSARRFQWSISPEEGRRLSLRLRVAGRETGSDYTLWRTRAAWAEYLRLPPTRHAVLALRLSGALARGSLGGAPPYSLGGIATPNPVDLFLLQTFSASDQLRGYPAGGQAGNGVALLNLELRTPLFSPELGLGAWPAFLRRVHAAAFADVGETFVHGRERGYSGPDFRWDRLRVGVGLEARLELVLAYWLVTDLRLGLARGLGRPLRGQWLAEDPLATWQGYLTFGPSF